MDLKIHLYLRFLFGTFCTGHVFMPPQVLVYVTGQLARMLVVYDRTVDQKAWALRTVQKLAADPMAMQARSGLVATAVAVVAFNQADDALGRTALDTLARLAIERQDADLLVRAGYMMKLDQR